MVRPRVVLGRNLKFTKAAWLRLRRSKRRQMMNRRIKGRSGLSSMVRSIVQRSQETKYVANAYTPSDSVNPLPSIWYTKPNIPLVGDCFPAIPQMTQGPDDFQRIGNTVRPTSLAVSLKIGFNALDLSANELIGVIYYGTAKGLRTWDGGNTIPTVRFLDNGDGTNVAWGGVRNTLTCPIDSRILTAKRITFKLSKTQGLQNGDVNPAGAQGGFATSYGSSQKNFLLKYKVPSVLTYQDKNDIYPQNFAPFYAIGFCHSDGSPFVAADVPSEDRSTGLVNVNAKCHLHYKDA